MIFIKSQKNYLKKLRFQHGFGLGSTRSRVRPTVVVEVPVVDRPQRELHGAAPVVVRAPGQGPKTHDIWQSLY
jgi:hypothetical protein